MRQCCLQVSQWLKGSRRLIVITGRPTMRTMMIQPMACGWMSRARGSNMKKIPPDMSNPIRRSSLVGLSVSSLTPCGWCGSMTASPFLLPGFCHPNSCQRSQAAHHQRPFHDKSSTTTFPSGHSKPSTSHQRISRITLFLEWSVFLRLSHDPAKSPGNKVVRMIKSVKTVMTIVVTQATVLKIGPLV